MEDNKKTGFEPTLEIWRQILCECPEEHRNRLIEWIKEQQDE